jgi:hypothetical protein
VVNVIATPQQLATIAQVLDAYCVAFSVQEPGRRERLGLLLLQFVEHGKTSVEDLSAALEEQIANGFLNTTPTIVRP